MSGKMNKSFTELFSKQVDNQKLMFDKGMYGDKKCESLPTDDISLASYHIQQLMSEIGEVLDADKRWKNFRNEKYDKEAKLEELADCFIVLMNVTMFSGFSGDDIAKAMEEKLNIVSDRVSSK